MVIAGIGIFILLVIYGAGCYLFGYRNGYNKSLEWVTEVIKEVKEEKHGTNKDEDT